jgi:hypothetical protein
VSNSNIDIVNSRIKAEEANEESEDSKFYDLNYWSAKTLTEEDLDEDEVINYF